MLKVFPPIRACVLFSLRLFAVLFVVVTLLGAVANSFNGRPFMGFYALLQLGGFFVAIAAVLGVFLYGLLRACAWTISPAGLSGRNFWGRRSHLEWSDIGNVAAITVEGIPALVVTSATSKREVYAYTLGVDLREVHTSLCKHAGPNNTFTACFRSRAA